jgi:hypothetical protein
MDFFGAAVFVYCTSVSFGRSDRLPLSISTTSATKRQRRR